MSKSRSLPLLATDLEVSVRMDACLQHTPSYLFSPYIFHYIEKTNALHRRLRSESIITFFV